MSDQVKTAAKAAAAAIQYNLPVDGFGDSKRLTDYSWIWGNAVAKKLADKGMLASAPIDLTSGALQDRLAQACGDPGSIVGRQHHTDEPLSRWQMRAVLHVLAETVPASNGPVTVPVAGEVL